MPRPAPRGSVSGPARLPRDQHDDRALTRRGREYPASTVGRAGGATPRGRASAPCAEQPRGHRPSQGCPDAALRPHLGSRLRRPGPVVAARQRQAACRLGCAAAGDRRGSKAGGSARVARRLGLRAAGRRCAGVLQPTAGAVVTGAADWQSLLDVVLQASLDDLPPSDAPLWLEQAARLATASIPDTAACSLTVSDSGKWTTLAYSG